MTPLYPEENNHNNNFDIIRFILAVLVVFTHGYLVYYGNVAKVEPLELISGNQMGFGTLAVNFFFIISGFLVLQSWLYSKTFFQYLKSRILRIYPAFVVVAFACAFIFGPLGTGTPQSPFSNITNYWSEVNLSSLTFTTLQLKKPDVPTTFTQLPYAYDINTSLWTIRYEFLCYLIIPFLALFNTFKSKLLPFVLYILVSAVYIYIHFSDYDFTAYFGILNTIKFTSLFLAGACFYHYRAYIPRSRYLFLLSSAVLIITLLWVRIFSFVLPVFGGYILFYLIFNRTVRFKNFSRYGDFSYGIYLYSWPIQQLVMMYFGQKLNFFLFFISTLLIIIPVAALSWHLIEKPFLALKKKQFTLSMFSLRSRIL